jgi:uncharacterized protein YndB with AHSA1/START domain
MPRTRRSRLIAAARPDVWDVVSDPEHLPRWWPKVVRVENVHERRRGSGSSWTNVFETRAGRSVRADFRCLFSKESQAYGWRQEIEGSPFAKALRSSETRIELEDGNGGTVVSLETDQRMRGMSRLGGWMVRRATGAQLEEALDGLERATGAGGAASG